MQKVISLFFLAFMSFLNASEAANPSAMPNFKQIYDHPSSPRFHSASRPKVDKNKKNRTSVEEDMRLADEDHVRAPISNPEDRVIEFIVTDIGR